MAAAIFVLTLFFANGTQDVQRHEYTGPHAMDRCRAGESTALEETRQRVQRGLLKGYTLQACHTEDVPAK